MAMVLPWFTKISLNGRTKGDLWENCRNIVSTEVTKIVAITRDQNKFDGFEITWEQNKRLVPNESLISRKIYVDITESKIKKFDVRKMSNIKSNQ